MQKLAVTLSVVLFCLVCNNVSGYEYDDYNTDIILPNDLQLSQQLGKFSGTATINGSIDGGADTHYVLNGNQNKGLEINITNSSYNLKYAIKNIGQIEKVSSGGTEVKLIDANGNVYTQNLSFKDGVTNFLNTRDTTSQADGGAFYFWSRDTQSAVDIANTVFTNNHLTLDKKLYGGAITAKGVQVNLDNTLFKGNSIETPNGETAQGGALFQTYYASKAEYKNSITNSYFIDNKIVAPNAYETSGGAVYMEKGDLVLDNSYFGNNTIQAISANGGAMALMGGNVKNADITNIVFDNNTINITNGSASGGALYHYGNASGTVNVKNTAFLSNSITTQGDESGDQKGGAYSVNKSGNFNVDNVQFKDNHINNNTGKTSYGGALFADVNNAKIENSRFENNSASVVQPDDKLNLGAKADGGAFHIADDKTAAKIYEVSNSTFKNNAATSNLDARGGAIYTGSILKVSDSNFIGNSATTTSDYKFNGAKGGAINTGTYSSYVIVDNSNFEGNSTNTLAGERTSNYGGGAIYNSKIALIKDSIFKNNSANGTNNKYNDTRKGTFGGAILNASKGVLSIMAHTKDVLFEGNKYGSTDTQYVSNAIYTDTNSIVNLNAAEGKKIEFNDGIQSSDDSATLNINQKGNWDTSTAPTDADNKISKDAGTTGEIALNSDMSGFLGTVNLFGGRISIGQNGSFFSKAKEFVVKASSNATVSFSEGIIKEYDLGNLKLEDDLKVVLDADLGLDNPVSDSFTSQSIEDNGNKILISEINILSDLLKTSAVTKVVDDSLKEFFDISKNPEVNITGNDKNYLVTYDNKTGELSFEVAKVNLNSAFNKTEDGRIYAFSSDEIVESSLGEMGGENTTMTISGNNNSILSKNDSEGMSVKQGQTLNINNVKNIDGFKDNTAIKNEGTINLSNVTMNDKIENKGTLTLANATINEEINAGSSALPDASVGSLRVTSNSTINNNVVDNTISLEGGVLTLGQNANIYNPTTVVEANGGALSLQNGVIQSTNIHTLNLNGDLNLRLDANLRTKEMDIIDVDNFNANGHYINITDIIVLEPTTDETFSISPLAKDKVGTDLAQAIKYTGGEIVYSPIFKYNAEYDSDSALLNFNRVKSGAGRPGYQSFNPGILATPVAAQLGGYLTQLNSYDEAFMNMDMYMLLPLSQRLGMKLRNRYAFSRLAQNNESVDAETTNIDEDSQEDTVSDVSMNYTSDPLISQYENRSGWFRPYTTLESVSLRGGPKVSNRLYGSYFGTDSNMKSLRNGWDRMWSTYIGYNGSHQSYDNVSIYQNGGTLGFSTMLFKNNFFTGLTANAGANSGIADSLFGKDNFTMLLAGAASKTGYNFEFKKGKFIIQPSLMMSYSFVNSFDYTTTSNVKVSSSPLHAITFEPGIKFIANLKNNYQPYAGVSFIFNFLDKTNFQANDVSLPDLSVKPFVKYGVGVRKLWGERVTGFVQTYVTNGGRTGIGFQAGLNMLLGGKKNK